ncbi:hypothetical protein NQ315_004101 [Exocentrus adspersus]|uniref:Lipase n=1 Tax=Exocentrus adspersus TaxID=1586481 RepID=A0AAV8W8J8_9CUCU|nr:hypothetical protein NQ315_004101 [Exocentrus adspersus]
MNGLIHCLVLIIIFDHDVLSYTDDTDLNATQLISKYGYPVEIHEVETEDGYLLDLFRIPYGREESNGTPVIINHGLMGSAENFIVMGPNKSLAYMLADHGYDVWLCNARGSMHSRKHKTLNPDTDAEFWKFTWHEIGVYDLPATIDYILDITNTQKVHYIGHSQGTTVFFVLCSERPEYNEKIKVMIAMAPSAILRHFKQPVLKMIAPFYPMLERLSEQLGVYELPPFISSKDVQTLGKALCGKNRILPFNILCQLLVLMIEPNDEELDKSVIPLAASFGTGGGSVRQALHYAQILQAGVFRNYDWGPKLNMKKIWFCYATTDVEILAKLLPNVVELYKVPSKTWTHMDFLWAKHIDVLVHDKIINIMKKYDYS